MGKKFMVKFYSYLREKYSSHSGGEEVIIIDNDGDYTIEDLKKQYDFIPGEIGCVILNKQMAEDDAIIQDGNLVEIFPFFGGG
ncbi:MAG: hypothetical protein CVU89_15595 [Firmicutes bacterium HGW-Firmicutes-14]|jgi:molybdopterin converting factor small subunit|nr:MAG: hypothetical protein CVU89_15595 [Firmicutes bacterium HGW-Firmicutes-14]